MIKKSRLQQKLESGGFAITAEVCPPKGCDCDEFLTNSRALQKCVDAINVTDNQGANMRISPVAAAALLVREGIEPVLQLTCRDRNRMALQSELLGAAALGIRNVLALTGDHISCGDHSKAKPVFDLDSVQFLQVIAKLNAGQDLTGNRLDGIPSLYAGAAAAPSAEPFDLTLFKLEKKVVAGAHFFQTQAVFDLEQLSRFSEVVRSLNVKAIFGVLLLKSAGQARFINRNIPGLTVPDNIIAELEEAIDPIAQGVAIARRLVTGARLLCDGVHVMAMGREDLIPIVLASV